jgi:hypothetical protein
MAQN